MPEGEIVALVGTNGAGKTTTLRAISGFLPSEDVAITDGAITLRGERINGRMPHQLAKAGVILVPERDKVFATLSVQDNLAFAARPEALDHASSASMAISRACANDRPSSPAISAVARSRCWRSAWRCCAVRRCY